MSKYTFRYGKSTMMTTDFGAVIITLVTVLGVFIIIRGEMLGGCLVIIFGSGILAALYINAKFTLSTIHVDDDAISASAFGFVWKTLKWTSVRKISSAQLTTPGFSKPTTTFVVQTIAGNCFYLRKQGPIIFNDSINDFQLLIYISSNMARVHNIDLLFSHLPDSRGSVPNETS